MRTRFRAGARGPRAAIDAVAHADPAACWWAEAAARRGERGAVRTGFLGAGDPSADRARRHVTPALHVLGRAHYGRRSSGCWTRCRPAQRGVLDAGGSDMSAPCCTSKSAARVPTSCCCMAGPCTVACGDRGSTSSRGARACISSTCPGHGRSPWPDRPVDLRRSRARRFAARAAGCRGARLVAGRHGGAGTRALPTRRPGGAGADRDDAVFPGARRLGRRHESRRAGRFRGGPRQRLPAHHRQLPRAADLGRRARDAGPALVACQPATRTANPIRRPCAAGLGILRDADLRDALAVDRDARRW